MYIDESVSFYKYLEGDVSVPEFCDDDIEFVNKVFHTEQTRHLHTNKGRIGQLFL